MIGVDGPAPVAAAVRERPLWAVLKGNRAAVAVARDVAGYGIELRIVVDRELRWSRMYRGGQGLETESEAKRRALEDLGWCAAE